MSLQGGGESNEVSVKIRVMQCFFLVLLRCYIITGAGVFMRDVRFYHRFGDKHVLRDEEVREASMQQLEQVRTESRLK